MTAFTFIQQLNGREAMVNLDNVLFIEKLESEKLRIHYVGGMGHMDTETNLNDIYKKMFTVERVEHSIVSALEMAEKVAREVSAEEAAREVLAEKEETNEQAE